MTTRQIEAIDSQGIPRVYGIGLNNREAIQQCVWAAESYLLTRADINALYLRDADTGEPIMEAASKQQWRVTI
jgi:hypothetical protein